MINKTLLFVLCVSSSTGVSVSAAADDTPYGSCAHRAEVYQRRYEASNQSSDLVCYQKALLRELRSSQEFDCPRSAQHYQTAYEKGNGSSDLVCYNQTLTRELKQTLSPWN